MNMRRVALVVGGLLTTALATAGCASNGPLNAPKAAVSVSAQSGASKLVPAAIRKSGKLTIGIDPTYAPNEYRDASGRMTGWDVDLFTAIAKRMGLKAVFNGATFDNILPSVKGGRYNLGVSSFTDNAEREKQVDFVTYFSAGYQWAVRTGSKVTPANPCGLTVATGVGTDEALHDIPDLSKRCVKQGKKPIKLLVYQTQDLSTQAVVLGKADAMDVDSPVTGYAVKKTNGKLALAGRVYQAAPYGALLAKDAGTLKQALQKAIQSMIDDGTYKQILTTWGVQSGAIKTAQINAAAG